ncbi:SDR family oxidoreductase [Roseinatronobacter bogoriensis]|uniref:Short chain dehydrogenase n=1 Tax=Roseinatronobacter bogoriensis subsp. barguzinensis TaxID=441209 RepID=A0A2K8K7G3_9RHOB|nr:MULTISPECIES: SDR family oxidoreductase [Rhodobaca]ATX65401.1 short chain dehydrogenase [Rhodobaca barguzinensis]MBB4208987.1 NAD(P)-dependent dehydrogenase (short-subunit alcohol dehydrogenase family) [Rhodobaca bogoriensis DSM 18756]TDW37588.1 NAD(P)-dependent dehydrogenase (short-subunit alcohol dehydrogenase family) [Rhodobaca barguzinensis]TDY68198.1 NAD(P)-dependent dehydrogenase (short-subunit alcohol dehydrogenase family) [Rhodobaca bogoriensis DSM 18756]
MSKALVTGAAQRLGRAMALYLAQRGYDVAIHYANSAQAAEELAQEIEGLGRKAICLRADLLDEAALAPLVPDASRALGGPLTVLVNNASIFEQDSIATATRESWDRHLMSNLRAPFVLTQQFAAQCPPPLPDSAEEPVAQGLVVNMIDQKVRKLTPEHMTYSIAKMGLWAFTRMAAQELGPKIRVNAIGPGPTLQAADQPLDQYQHSRESTVLGRGANPDDITAALGFFLDAHAVTGQLLCVDGGQHLIWKTPDITGPDMPS